MKNTWLGKIGLFVAAICVATAVASPAQTFNTLFKFSAGDGEAANGPLVQGTDGNFYGTAGLGGANHSRKYCSNGDQYGCGTIFEITPKGKFSVVYNFCSLTDCADGGVPSAGLVLATNGNLYGTTNSGGANNNGDCNGAGCGTVFEITSAGKLTTLYSFCSQQPSCADGIGPGQLVQGANGNFFGTTASGGILDGNNGCPDGCGTVFEITQAGQFTTLYKFCGCGDGEFPLSGLAQAANGNFYGMTGAGGGYGSVFEITPAGKFSQIYSFCSLPNCADGEGPVGTLLQGASGYLYGATQSGGAYASGTIFEITGRGKLTTLHSFCAEENSQGACADGSTPQAGLIRPVTGTSTGRLRSAEMRQLSSAPLPVAARFSNSRGVSSSQPFTVFAHKRTVLTAPFRSRHSCSPPTERSTG
jgi:uncharacterized repeat protein (TIGR03803 family)